MATMAALKPRTDAAREELATLFRALAEPMRLQLLEELRSGPRQFGDLADAVGGALSWTSKQLKNLHQAGLIARRRESTKVWYSLRDDLPEEVCALICERRGLNPKPAASEPKKAQEQATLFDF